MAFVVQAMERLFESPSPASEELGVSLDQLLADLELLEWIAAGQPSNRVQLLGEMQARYLDVPVPPGGKQPAICHRMRECIAAMLQASDHINVSSQ